MLIAVQFLWVLSMNSKIFCYIDANTLFERNTCNSCVKQNNKMFYFNLAVRNMSFSRLYLLHNYRSTTTKYNKLTLYIHEILMVNSIQAFVQDPYLTIRNDDVQAIPI